MFRGKDPHLKRLNEIQIQSQLSLYSLTGVAFTKEVLFLFHLFVLLNFGFGQGYRSFPMFGVW
jgi:hypothetical protein